jgi:uncharacterized membrane protein YkoI
MGKGWKVLALGGAVCASAPVLANDDVKLEQLPPEVKETVARETKGGTVQEIDRDEEQGQTVFEVEYTKDGARWELDVASDGKVLRRHRD